MDTADDWKAAVKVMARSVSAMTDALREKNDGNTFKLEKMRPKVAAMTKMASVCSVAGTGQKGTVILPATAISMLPKSTRAP